MYEIEFTSSSRRFLMKLEPAAAKQIVTKIESIRENPYHFTSVLVEREGVRKLRVGNFRVLLTIDQKRILITVVEIGHRRNIYK